MKHTCKCGTEFVLESYHHREEGCESMCHRCYRKLLPPMTAVKMLTDLTGWNPFNLMFCSAAKGDIALVMKYVGIKGRYLLVAGGFYFWAVPEDIKEVPPHAVQYMKDAYTPVTPGEHILAQVQQELKEYHDEH